MKEYDVMCLYIMSLPRFEFYRCGLKLGRNFNMKYRLGVCKFVMLSLYRVIV